MTPLASNLNPEQRRAVETTEGPVLIVAGAGSGKTKTLTHRVVHLMQEKGVSAQHILAVTFTNKAAEEMRGRVASLLSQTTKKPPLFGKQPVGLPHIGTFHSICSRILRKDIAVLGYKTTFTILDSDDQLALMKRTMKSLEIDPKNIHPRALLDAVSRAKNQLLDELVFESRAGSYYEELVAKAYRKYQEELRSNHTLDFDDLLRLTIQIFHTHPETLNHYRNLFHYIMVDEYQDTNHAQYTLIHLLAEKHRNLFAIGDDYQSIYGWRQADIRNILNFEKDYPEATIVTLDQNYRSTQTILDAAGSVIAKNANQRHKKLWTSQEGGAPLTIFEAEDERGEADYVIRKIQETAKNASKDIDAKQTRSFSEFAILYRTNAQSRALEEACLNHSVPYRIIGGLKFYGRKEVKDAIAYLRLVANHWDTLSLARIANEPPRGIGKKTLESWLSGAKSAKTDPITFAREDEGKQLNIAISKQKSAAQLANILHKNTQKLLEKGSLSTFLATLLESVGYIKALEDGTEEGSARLENVRELFSVAKKYDGTPLENAITFFLEEIALVSDTDAIDGSENAVQLMTLHSAKGLEFPFVFLVGLEEGIFPHSRSALSPAELEEERRLMYVGLTRAKEKAWLISAETRMIFGSTQMNAPSRFISEIPEHLVRTEERKKGRDNSEYADRHQMQTHTSHSTKPPTPHNQATVESLRPGDAISHPTFGNGIVIKIEGTLATIAFRTKGVKKLALGIAPIEKI
ncbi:MAG: UvrD-helicase domain-containing protein [Candidatus Moraniibacteriota bacterium]|nr:MAG: UvrD-helicase domain-containing protein [Candidatus Moranbacteria bacterium]